MDGLDASEISISKVREENPYFRIDSSFFGKRVIKALNLVKRHNYIYFSPKSVVNGPFGSTITSDLHRNNGFMPLVRSLNINSGFFINKTNLIYISEEDNNMIKHSQLGKDDIVLSRVGSIGFFARVDADLGACNISSNNIGIKLDGYTESEKHYIVTYLNTILAKTLTNRRVSGNVQSKLTVSEICCIPIPTFNETLYKSISILILSAEKMRKDSSDSYEVAVSILLSAIGISNFTLSQQAVSVKLFSKSYGLSGRLDAEYYQLKYDQLFDIFKNFPTKTLGGKNGIVTIKKSIEPGSNAYCENGIPFVRVCDVTKFGISEPAIKLPSDIVSNVSSLYPHKNTILFSKDGSVGIAYKVEKDLKIITSGALLHLTVKNPNEVLPDYLTLVLNSPIVQLQAERDSSGAIIQHWKPSEIEKVVIPVLDIDVQKQISKKVQKSFALRQQSEALLDYAKRAVEIAIEQDEATAVEWLKEKGVEC